MESLPKQYRHLLIVEESENFSSILNRLMKLEAQNLEFGTHRLLFRRAGSETTLTPTIGKYPKRSRVNWTGTSGQSDQSLGIISSPERILFVWDCW